jgi:hypothetical protein
MDGGGWVKMTSQNAKQILPVIAAHLVHAYKNEMGANTGRVAKTENERYCTDIQVWRGDRTIVKTPLGAKYEFEEVWVRSLVGRSRGKDQRQAFAVLTVAMPSNLAVAIQRTGCLYPRGSIAMDGSWLGTKDYTACRQSAKGCGHGFCCLNAAVSPHTVGITEGSQVWGRDRDKKCTVDPNQSAVQAVFSGKTHDDGTFEAGVHPVNGGLPVSEACPFSSAHFSGMRRGLAHTQYLDGAHKLMTVLKNEYARIGGTKNGNSNLVGRSLKLEAVLPPTASMRAAAAAVAAAKAAAALN